MDLNYVLRTLSFFLHKNLPIVARTKNVLPLFEHAGTYFPAFPIAALFFDNAFTIYHIRTNLRMQLKIFMTYYILQNELNSIIIVSYPSCTILLTIYLYYRMKPSPILHIILLNLKKSFIKKDFFYFFMLFNHFSKICTIPCFPANFSSPCFVLYGYNCKKTPQPDSIFLLCI